MTIVAGVRRSKLDRLVRPRDAEAVIMPIIDDHVGPDRHVAGGARYRWSDLLMLMVLRNLELAGVMALQAQIVAREARLGAVWLMAIAAGHARREHLTLLERAVVIDLVAHLAVRMIEPAGKSRDGVGIGQRAAWNPSFREG